MAATIPEKLTHGASGIGRHILQWRRIASRCRHHDAILHGPILFQGTHHLGHGRALLTDSHINADHPRVPRIPLRLGIPGFTLIDNGIERYRRLAGLPIANDQLALATADRHHRVDRLQTRLQWLAHGLPIHHPGGDALDRAGVRRINRSLPINGLAQRVDHPANHRFTHRHLHDAAGAVDLITLLNFDVLTQQHGANVVFFKIQGHTVDVMRKL